MSLLWRDQLEVFLAPGRIDLALSSRGFKSVEQPIVTEQVSPPAEGHVTWEKPLQQLEAMLTEREGAGLTMTVSNHFVRYACLAPQVEITTPEEVFAYADFRMREIYGARVDHWVISISAWNPVYGAICAAIPQEFMAKIEEITERHNIMLNGINPYITAVLDRWEKTLNRNKSFVALIETGRLCVGVMIDGVWQSIRNQRILNNAADELWAVLDQEAVLTGQKEADEQVFLLAPEHPSLVLPPDCGWQITQLPTEKISVPRYYPRQITESAEENACPA